MRTEQTADHAAIFCQNLLGMMTLPEFEDAAVDLVDIEWQERGKRVLRRQSRTGRAFRILLPANQFLDHGAIIARDDERAVAINILPCEAFVMRGSPDQLISIAYGLGNLHLPAEIGRAEIIVPASQFAEAALGKLGIKFEAATRRIQVAFELLPRLDT